MIALLLLFYGPPPPVAPPAENGAVPFLRLLGTDVLKYRPDRRDAFAVRLGATLSDDPPGLVGWMDWEFERATAIAGPDGDTFAEGRRLSDEYDRAARPWREGDCPNVALWLAENAAAFPALEAAAARPRFVVPAGDGFASSLIFAVGAARGLWLRRAMRRAADGESDAAWADLLAATRLTRRFARENGPLTAYAEGGAVASGMVAWLAAADPPADAIADRRADLAALPPVSDPFGLWRRDAFGRFREYELPEMRARPGYFALTISLLHATDGIGWKAEAEAIAARLGLSDYGLFNPGDRWPAPVDWKEVERLVTDWWAIADRLTAARPGAITELARGADDALLFAAAARDPETDPAILHARVVAAGLIADAARDGTNYLTLSRTTRQAWEVTDLAFRLVAFEKRTGAFPETLADLPGPVPVDRLNDGRPLAYRRTAEGFDLWSVGLPTWTDAPGGDDPDRRDALFVRWPPR